MSSLTQLHRCWFLFLFILQHFYNGNIAFLRQCLLLELFNTHISLSFLLLLDMLDRVLISVTTLAICLSYPQLRLSHSVFIAAFTIVTIVVIVSLFSCFFSTFHW